MLGVFLFLLPALHVPAAAVLAVLADGNGVAWFQAGDRKYGSQSGSKRVMCRRHRRRCTRIHESAPTSSQSSTHSTPPPPRQPTPYPVPHTQVRLVLEYCDKGSLKDALEQHAFMQGEAPGSPEERRGEERRWWTRGTFPPGAAN